MLRRLRKLEIESGFKEAVGDEDLEEEDEEEDDIELEGMEGDAMHVVG
ncbi:hypothetical protein PC116_g30069 [Phytophthora cactorum]|nr:hypothetical protein PC116_g30069 [Phytophthora cactorum]